MGREGLTCSLSRRMATWNIFDNTVSENRGASWRSSLGVLEILVSSTVFGGLGGLWV